MSDPKETPGSSAESNPDPLPSQSPAPRAEGAERQQPAESWFDRLRAAVGLRSASAREELEEALEDGGPDSTFTPEERVMLGNILELREVRVADIMVPRADIDAVDIETTLGALMAEFQECGHSRMPVYRESLDDPVGMVHIKDLMIHLAREATVPARPRDGGVPHLDLRRVDLGRTLADAGLVRNVLFVPASMPVARLLAMMQSSRMQMALVIDEFGGTDGAVSIEDVVETIVGDIEDEHDEIDPEIVAEGDGWFVADAGTSLEDVAAAVGGELGKDRSGDEVDTIGGQVFSLLGRIPQRGEQLSIPGGYDVVIVDADRRRIRQLRIRRRPEPAAPELPVDREEDPPRAARA